MRLLTLPITIARVPIELGLGAAKQAVKLAQGLVGGGEEPVAESRPAPPAPRRRTSSRSRPKSGNGRARSGTAAKRPTRSRAKQATKAAPPIDEPASAAAKEAMQAAPPIDAPANAAAAEEAMR
ncbi:MAG TPA: hypothetical protein VGW14_01180, partial [Thermoleophilaceae bacterium]|nr:hypothetical protein [Thermoleophilaceae bacterium]